MVTRETKEKFRKLLLAYLDALGRREGKDHVVSLYLPSLCRSIFLTATYLLTGITKTR